MKVHPLRSVGAKLFYMMSLLVLITVIGNSLQYMRMFRSYQTDQVQDQTLLLAERAAGQFENSLDTWKSQIAVALPTLRGVDPKTTDAQLQRFVDSSNEFLALELLEAPTAKSTNFTLIGHAFASGTSEPRFEDKLPAKVRAKIYAGSIAWLKSLATKAGKTPVPVQNVAKSIELPALSLAVRFDVSGSSSVIWAVLTVWQTNLIKSLPKSGFINSAVIDTKGRVFSSHKLMDMLDRRPYGGALAATALAGISPTGFQPEYRDTHGKRRLGAFARMPRYGLSVLVEQDAEVAYQALNKSLLSTALIGVLFVLFAVAFAWAGAASINKGLRAVTHATAQIAAGDFQHEIRLNARDEVGKLASDVNHMSRKIRNLLDTQVEKARYEKELETAKIVQSTFFPRTHASNGPILLSGYYQPASECGGDLWGHYPIGDGIEFVFIGDAMGHGAPAALVTAIAYSTAMTVADIIRDHPEFKDSPARLLERLNRVIFEAVQGSISMTFFAAMVDTHQGIVTYSNAGHNFPVVLPASADDPRSGRKRLRGARVQPISLKLRGTPLGMTRDAKYSDRTTEIRPGDKILLFTDGLIECSSPKGEVWGRKHLLEQAAEVASLPATEMKDELLSRAFTFFGGKPLDDDVTMVVVELSDKWKHAQGIRKPPTVPPPLPDHLAPPILEPKVIPEIMQLSLGDDRSLSLSGPSSEANPEPGSARLGRQVKGEEASPTQFALSDIAEEPIADEQQRSTRGDAPFQSEEAILTALTLEALAASDQTNGDIASDQDREAQKPALAVESRPSKFRLKLPQNRG